MWVRLVWRIAPAVVASVMTASAVGASLSSSSAACAFVVGFCAPGVGFGGVTQASLGGNDNKGFSYSESVQGSADYGSFKGATSIFFSVGDAGDSPTGEFLSVQAQGIDTEVWTITGGSGNAFLQLAWTIHGSVGILPSVVSTGDMFIIANETGGSLNKNQTTGLVSSSGVYAGKGDLFPFTFGVPFPIQFTSIIESEVDFPAIPFSGAGGVMADFSNTSTLTGATVTDALGHVIQGVTISSDAGLTFPLQAPNETPEPGTFFAGLAALALGYAARRHGMKERR